jgi:hypothetical protein
MIAGGNRIRGFLYGVQRVGHGDGAPAGGQEGMVVLGLANREHIERR